MERERDKKLHFYRPVITPKIKGWRGSVHLVNIGLSAGENGKGGGELHNCLSGMICHNSGSCQSHKN
jgi:hypothetical protein